MRPFSLLIKPASADCNLNCRYCFYLDRKNLYPETVRHRMSTPVLEKLISSYMATPQPQYVFGWQGGEPTLMGLEFFKQVVEFQKKYGLPGSSVANGLQTNATLITDELAAFFAEYKFLLGVSLDGPAEIHNTYRLNADNHPSHQQVLHGIECLKKNKVDFNALVLVNANNVKKPKDIYSYLCEQGIFWHQYIPCVEFDANGHKQPFAITGAEWGDFLCAIFEEWIKRDIHKVSIRLFDSIISFMVDNKSNICQMENDCAQYFVVEYNGDIYPCDFFVQKDLKLGNIGDDSWNDLQKSIKYLDFGRQKAMLNEQCISCEYSRYCFGDCLKHRIYGNNNAGNISCLCEGIKKFYQHSLKDFESLALSIKKDRRAELIKKKGDMKIGRNDPCFCGSGKKFKKCCG